MSIITISRQLGSRGDRIAHALADRLGYRLVRKEDVLAAAEAYGLRQDELKKLDERRPGLRERLFRERLSIYLDLLQCVIYDLAQRGDAVVLGLGGNVLLERIPTLLRAKIIAPMEVRVARVMEDEKVGEAAALELVQSSDRDRAGYTRYLFNFDWMNPLGYDLILNSGTLEEKSCVDVLFRAASLPEVEGRRQEALEILTTRALLKRVEVALLTSRQVDARFISVTVPSAGTVELHGMVTSESEKTTVAQVVSEVEGVELVRNELAVTIIPVGQMEPL